MHRRCLSDQKLVMSCLVSVQGLVLASLLLDRCCQVDVKQSKQTDSSPFQVNQCAGIMSSCEWQFTLHSAIELTGGWAAPGGLEYFDLAEMCAVCVLLCVCVCARVCAQNLTCYTDTHKCTHASQWIQSCWLDLSR